MSARRVRRLIILLLAVVVVVVACVLIGFRIGEVNDALLERHVLAYGVGEPVSYATFAGEKSDGASLSVLGSALLDQKELDQVVPGYENRVIKAGGASDMKALVVRLRLVNAGDKPVDSPAQYLKLRAGAWANGVDPLLIPPMNPSLSTLQLQPGEQEEVLVTFEAYNTQFGFNTAQWQNFSQSRLQLVLASYPDDVYIDLGRPGNPQDLGLGEGNEQ